MSSSIITASNPYALSVNGKTQILNKRASGSANALSTGVKSDMSVVDQDISSKISFNNRTLRVVENNMLYQKAQMDSMSNSLSKMKSTVGKMQEITISAKGKSPKVIEDLAETMEKFTTLFNSQLSEAKFDNKFLLGGLKYNSNARTGLDADKDSFHMEVEAVNPIVGKKKILTHFESASAVGAKLLRDFGVDRLTEIAAACQSASFAVTDFTDTVPELSRKYKDMVINNTKTLQAAHGADPVKNKVYQKLIHAFSHGGTHATTQVNNPYLIKQYAIDVMNQEISALIGDSSDLSSVVRSITSAMRTALGSATKGDQYDETVKNILNAPTANGVSGINFLPNQGGIIGKAVIDELTKNKNVIIAALPDDGTMLATDTSNLQPYGRMVQGIVQRALTVALEAAVEATSDLVVKSIHGQRDSGLGLHMHETLKIAATATNMGAAADPSAPTHVHAVLHNLQESIAVIRNNPDAPIADGVGVFANNEAFNHLKEVVKAGPIAIEDTLTAAGAIRAAAFVGTPDQALDLSQVNMRNPEEITQVETFLKGLKRNLDHMEMQVSSYRESLITLSDSITQNIEVNTDINETYAATDIVKEAEKFSEGLNSLKLAFNVLNSGSAITEAFLQNVKEALASA